MKKKYPLLVATFALVATASLHAQIFYSNGATVAVTTGGILYCNGGITLDNTSSFTNDGSVTTTKNSSFALPGTFTINSGSAQGSGTYNVEQDWINNSAFVANNSTVRLYGNTQQFITSINGTVTTFHNLSLLGTGTGTNRKKTLQLVNANSDATGQDSINDRELETLTNTFFVLNPSVTAVQNDQTTGSEGFVSSTAPGVLSRATNVAAAYLFPVGSSIGTTRYRPAVLTPNTVATNEFTVRFINNNPDADGYLRSTNDGSICTANPIWYHAILRPTGPATAADVTVYYLPASDGPWDGMDQWRTSNNMWNDMLATSQATAGTFTTRTKSGWLFANPGDPYVLTEQRPAAPTIVCPTFCENTTNNLFVATGGSSPYTWTIPGNGTISSGQGTDSLYVDWTTGTGNVTVTSVSPIDPTCLSLPSSCTPTVNPAPNAAFTTDTTSGGPWASTWTFNDITSGGSSWTWDFGDGQTSTQQNPTNNYTGAGTYTVTMTVVDANGCSDTAQTIVTVLEGLLIPNVFSPNGDGTNDEFYIPNSGLKEYKIEIYDRWGVKIFESEAPSIHWDGHSTSGMPCTDGTYYYILHALTNTHDYSTTGFITLIGSTKK